MMKLTISAAALLAAALITIPANADHIGGGPIHNADGKCWKDSSGPHDARYGYWQDCPKKTAGAVATDCAIGQLAWEKQHAGLQYFDHCRRGPAASAGVTAAR